MTQNNIRAGTVGYPVSKKLVLAQVDVVELTETNVAVPKQKTAKSLRKSAPDRVAFTIQLPRYLFESPPDRTPLPGDLEAYGAFRTTAENQNLWKKTLHFAEGVDALSLVLLTPPEFTPASVNRRALAAFLKTVERTGREIVWEPRGPWEYEQATSFAQDLGMTLAVDPLRDVPPPGNSAYLRLGPFAAMGSRVGVYDLTRVLDAAAPFKRVTCVFQTPRSFDDARNLKKILAQQAE
ncbi:MAG: DUF72 domain-containing protein [Deltaproteobacteria bacterium]|nr:DUF72 domain-containing protein [Deltaproteobacteria bacterium]